MKRQLQQTGIVDSTASRPSRFPVWIPIAGVSIVVVGAFIRYAGLTGFIVVLLSLVIVVVLYVFVWHPVQVARAERRRLFAVAKEAEARAYEIEVRAKTLDNTIWREDQSMLHEQQIAERKLELDHEYRMMQLRLQYEHFPLPVGHNLVVRQEERWQVIEGQRQAPKQITNNIGGDATGQALYPEPVDFSQVLSSFAPTAESIYLLNTVNDPVTVPMNKVCHVGLGGSTGGGKTNTTRLLAAQLLRCEAVMYLASPNFAQLKLNGNRLEDWRPIVAHLAAPPAQDDKDIERLIARFRQLFEQRKKDEQVSPRRGKDVFLVLGELPGIVKRLPDSVDTITLLLRESRQYGIHIISEFQDALVSTIGGSSGVRENYKTGYYFGGDDKTAKVLLDLPNGVKIEEVGLGDKGAAYLRSQANKAKPGRVPFLSNQALYMLLGEPPDPMSDDIVMYEDQVPTSYCHVDASGRYEDAPSGAGPIIVDSIAETRPDDRETPNELAIVSGYQTRQTGPLNDLPEPSDATSEDDHARLSDIQKAQFIAAYQIRPNIDECLKTIRVGSAYRQHAREIVKQLKAAGRA